MHVTVVYEAKFGEVRRCVRYSLSKLLLLLYSDSIQYNNSNHESDYEISQPTLRPTSSIP